jgi:SAM-dependent methyltransferase
MSDADDDLAEAERQKTIRRGRSRWQKLSRKTLLPGKLSTRNLERLCRENASDRPTLIVHSEDVDFRAYFPNAVTLSKSRTKEADRYVDRYYRDVGEMEAETYDVVLCTGLLEHVPEPQRLVDDIHRVLRPGGRAILSASATFSYHEGPDHYFMFTSWGMRHLFRDWSEIVSVQGSSQPFETVGILLQRILLQCDMNPFVRPIVEVLARIVPVFDRAVSAQFDSTWKYSDEHRIDSMMPSNVQLVAAK